MGRGARWTEEEKHVVFNHSKFSSKEISRSYLPHRSPAAIAQLRYRAQSPQEPSRRKKYSVSVNDSEVEALRGLLAIPFAGSLSKVLQRLAAEKMERSNGQAG